MSGADEIDVPVAARVEAARRSANAAVDLLPRDFGPADEPAVQFSAAALQPGEDESDD